MKFEWLANNSNKNSVDEIHTWHVNPPNTQYQNTIAFYRGQRAQPRSKYWNFINTTTSKSNAYMKVILISKLNFISTGNVLFIWRPKVTSRRRYRFTLSIKNSIVSTVCGCQRSCWVQHYIKYLVSNGICKLVGFFCWLLSKGQRNLLYCMWVAAFMCVLESDHAVL